MQKIISSTPSDWEQYAIRSHVYDSVVPERLSRLIFENQLKIQSFIDIGCGDGALLDGLKKQGWFAGRDIFGVDLSRERLSRVKIVCPEVTTIQAPAEALVEIQRKFDLVISTQVIEHVEDQQKMLSEMSRILNPGGMIFLSTVFKKWYGWYFHRCNGQWTIDPTHLREYRNDNELLPELGRVGLKLVSHHKDPIAYPLVDPIFRKMKIQQLDSRSKKILRKFRIPIPGYLNWEIIAIKP